MGMAVLLNYTRTPMEDEVYAARLAYSMHLALQTEEGWLPLNHNSGVLFAKATENRNGSLTAKSLKNPWIFPMRNGDFGVVAIRTEADGEEDRESVGCIVLWTTRDLLHYEEIGLIHIDSRTIDKVCCDYNESEDSYLLQWCAQDGIWRQKECRDIAGLRRRDTASAKITRDDPILARKKVFLKDEDTKIPGAVPHNAIEISSEQALYLKRKLLTPEITGIKVPEDICAASRKEAEAVRVMAEYSDGSSISKRVDWDFSGVDFENPGTYSLKGKVIQEHFAFPVALNRADPCVCRWQGKYYFIATNDADKEHTLYIREADSMEGLATAEEHLILDAYTYPEIGGLLWAPEFHEIKGRLYLFHAATPGPFYCEESHIMELREGGNPVCREDWSAPRRIEKADGSMLCEAGKTISLDMTHFVWEGEHYVVWSQRQFLPKDLGAWLYIAKLNPDMPWRLASDPVVLSKPEYGWANNHTFVDEGPYALVNGGKLYLTFSSAAVDSTYVVGLLTMEPGRDLLVRENWIKNNYPILTSRSVEGEYGTGHNAYVTDEFGNIWNTYHARPGIQGVRSSGIRRVHFDVDGCPVLDVTEEKDLKPEFSEVETILRVPERQQV